MGYPDDPLPDPSTWFSNVLVTAAAIKANIIDALNALRNIGRGFINEQSSGAITIATVGTTYLGDASVTQVVPAGGRRYLALIRSSITSASGGTFPARYIVAPAYNPGSTMDRSSTAGAGLKSAGTSVVIFGAQSAMVNSASQSQSDISFGTVFLAAGTYTFSCSINKTAGGAATDNANAFITLVDVGAA